MSEQQDRLLLAVTLFSRTEKEFGRKWPLQTLFEAPSIAELVNRLQLVDWKNPRGHRWFLCSWTVPVRRSIWCIRWVRIC